MKLKTIGAIGGGVGAGLFTLSTGGLGLIIPAIVGGSAAGIFVGKFSDYWLETNEKVIANQSKELEITLIYAKTKLEKQKIISDYVQRERDFTNSLQEKIAKSKRNLKEKKTRLQTDRGNWELNREVSKLEQKIAAEETVLRRKQTESVFLISQLEAIDRNPAALEEHPFNLTNVSIGLFSISLLLGISLVISIVVVKIRKMFKDYK